MTTGQPRAQTESQGKSTILVVDDAPAGRETLQALLFSDAYDLYFASDGLQALEMAATIRPDLILLDVMMPGIDGFEACRRLRAIPELAHIPIIMVTALDDRMSRLQGIESGADDFVSKPFDSAELRARVRTITRLNRYRRLVEERERFEWVVENAEDGYLLLSGDAITYANPQAQTLLGLDGNDCRTTHPSLLEIAQRTFRCEPKEIWERWPDVQIDHQDVHLFLIAPETTTSPVNWIEVTVYGRFSNAQVGRLIRLRDVTVAKTSLRDMWSFHTMVMHKLNTPMHMMLGSMELLTLSSGDILSTREIFDLVEMAASGAQRLASAINDVLQYATAFSITTRVGERFCLQDLPVLTTETARHLQMAHVTLDLPSQSGICLVISPRAMESILFELLENAKKFHPTHEPSIQIEGILDGDRFVLTVQDNGIHLSPDQLNRVWLPYYQGERYFTGEVQGMGLGLPLVASILWECGGDCHIINRSGAPGVIVHLSFPILPPL
ncbi:MAG: response regulator [Caldilineaceae bacterium]|nr:response regulator [Caldilineaceae bacterium]